MHDPAKSSVNALPITPAPPPGLLVADHFGASYGYHVRRPSGTRDWVITYTLSGEGRYRLPGQSFFCRPGDVFILEPGAPHDYATHSPGQQWEFYWSHFMPRPHWAAWLRLPALAPGLLAQSISDAVMRERIELTFARIVQDSRSGGLWQEDLALAGLEEILILAGQEHEKAKSQPLDPRVEAVLIQLNQRFRDRIVLGDLAKNIALSPSRLAHLFKAEVGVSIMETLLGLRLRQAARLLEYTSLSVGEIARDVGFHSPFYFSRQFKVYYGRSPSDYRQQAQSKVNGQPIR
jgi:AraC family transcriptional regulator of arabinose operon